jgi:hypothetical protein
MEESLTGAGLLAIASWARRFDASLVEASLEVVAVVSLVGAQQLPMLAVAVEGGVPARIC